MALPLVPLRRGVCPSLLAIEELRHPLGTGHGKLQLGLADPAADRAPEEAPSARLNDQLTHAAEPEGHRAEHQGAKRQETYTRV